MSTRDDSGFQKENLLLFRCQHHNHLPTFHLRELFYSPELLEVTLDALQQITAQFLVRHFAPPETQGDLDLVAFGKKLRQVSQLDVVVPDIRTRAELDFLDLNLLLLFA